MAPSPTATSLSQSHPSSASISSGPTQVPVPELVKEAVKGPRDIVAQVLVSRNGIVREVDDGWVAECFQRGSYKDEIPNARIAINAIKSGFLGTTPVLITVNDAGQVIVHFTESIHNSKHRPPIILNQPTNQSTWGIAIHPDSQLLAVSANSHTITVFDLRVHSSVEQQQQDCYPLGEGIMQRELKGHNNNIPGIEFSPCGQFLASVSIDCTCRVWDLETGECVAQVENGSTEEWNWSVNFVSPLAFRRQTPLDAIHQSQRPQPPKWASGVPECLKSDVVATRRSTNTTNLHLTTTILLGDVSSDDETVYSFGSKECEQEDNEMYQFSQWDSDTSCSSSENEFVDAADAPGRNNEDVEMLSRQTSYFSMQEEEDGVEEAGVEPAQPQLLQLHHLIPEHLIIAEAYNMDSGGNDEEDEDFEVGEGADGLTLPSEIPEYVYFEDDGDEQYDNDDVILNEADTDDDGWTDEDEVDGESIDSDYLWQRPVTQQPQLSSFEIHNESSIHQLDSHWVFYASLTDLWIVDFKTRQKVCELVNVFEGCYFGHYQMFDRE
ncbi:UNVERIFIED_CONTAM: hypothetical protein HDU68_006862 [Siphonaria sp. JEL0065]|nr:hypothetical protein HDU68_006862 [Siphonaria sp. JEL0065]